MQRQTEMEAAATKAMQMQQALQEEVEYVADRSRSFLLDAIADTLGTGEEGQEIARAIGRRWAQLEAASTNSRVGSRDGGNAEHLDGGVDRTARTRFPGHISSLR